MSKELFWKGLRPEAVEVVEQRDYSVKPTLAERLAGAGVEAREIAGQDIGDALIPGVVVFHRKVFPQPNRGFFGEFARSTSGPLEKIKMWPRQWATARMFAGSSKGFHIHPPHIPEGHHPSAWFQRLFVVEPENYNLRPYDKEQWDAMFFVQGICEMLLIDERPGMPRRVMRFTIYGDDYPGENNVGVVIPAGVAHAIRSGSSNDLIMVYGTSTVYIPENEGRIAHSVEFAPLPNVWENYIQGKGERPTA
jgi:dTDP-4-dehydrorhamnose 3,5-epimerase-like enzyme